MSKNKEEIHKDCLGCKLVGTIGLFAIAVYVFKDSSKNPKRSSRVLMNTIGTG
jgi:hypothetical protein